MQKVTMSALVAMFYPFDLKCSNVADSMSGSGFHKIKLFSPVSS